MILPALLSAAPKAASPALPFTFVENRGQADRPVRFIGNGPDFRAYFRADGVIMERGGASVDMTFGGAGAGPSITATDPAGGEVNYFRGSDQSKWLSKLPTYSTLEYRGVWPGIVVRFRASHDRVKAEYVVEPGGSPDAISLRFSGDASILADGSLSVAAATPNGHEMKFREDRPYLFQEPTPGARSEIPGAFHKAADGSVRFEVGAYNHSLPLVIDPVILLSGYFGGYSQTTMTAVAINSNYNIVTAGWTLASNLKSTGGAQASSGGNVDAFVAIFSPTGGTLLSCTYLGGSGDDRAFALALDSANYIYLTGWTQSKNFPVVSAYQTKLSGARDAFVAKLSPTAGAIMFSTYLGGNGVDAGNGIILDASNNPVVVGDTTSTNLPVTAGAAQRTNSGGQDAFVAKLTSNGSGLTSMTYYGGSGPEHATSVALDGSGSIYFGGSTSSQDFPVVSALQARPGGGQDAFVAKLSPDVKTVGFATYLGGAGGSPGALEQVNAMIFSVDNRLNVVGSAASPDFPITASAIQPTFGGGNTDGFYTRIDPAGKLIRSTFLGGSSDDAINAITADYDGYYYLAGNTTSPDFPVKNSATTLGGGMDAFVVKMLATKIIYATYLGGAFADSANGIAVDSLTNVVVAGLTASANYPVVGSIGNWQGSALSSFVTKLAPPYTLGLTSMPTFYTDIYHTTAYNGQPVAVNTYGLSTDIPIVGDWTNTGAKRLGVFRNGTWILDTNGNGVLDVADKTVSFGQAGDIPVVGDWNGTGSTKLGLFRQGTFILDLSGHLSGTATGLSDATFPFGQAGDVPVAGDWTQSGTTKVGVFRNGTWLLDYNGDLAFGTGDKTYTFGQAGDLPVVGDWSGSGTAKIGVFRGGLWILDYDGLGYISTNVWFTQVLAFGSSTFKPLVW